MQTEMNETNSKMGNQFFGDVDKPMSMSMSMSKECAMIGLMKHKVIVLNAELLVAEAELGRVSQDESVHWSIKKKKENNCSFVKGKISAVEELMKDFENMLAPIKMAM